MDLINLNLGCGITYKEDWINVDNNKNIKADRRFNLNKYPYPFKSKSCIVINASHIIEHLDDAEGFFQEAHRLLSDSGILIVVVPHFTNAMAQTPLHKGFYSYKGLKQVTTIFKKHYMKLKFTKTFSLLSLINPIIYENSPLRIFPAKEIYMELRK